MLHWERCSSTLQARRFSLPLSCWGLEGIGRVGGRTRALSREWRDYVSNGRKERVNFTLVIWVGTDFTEGPSPAC